MPLEPYFAGFLPKLRWLTTPKDPARLAADALSSTDPATQVTYLHDPAVPVCVQALLVSPMLAEARRITFHQLVEDAPTCAIAVSRFLVLLKPYGRGAVKFKQNGALDTLTIQWAGNEGSIDIDVDDYTGAGVAHSAMASSPHVAAIGTEGEDADE